MCGRISLGCPPPKSTCPPTSLVIASAPPAPGIVVTLMPAALPKRRNVTSTEAPLVDTDAVVYSLLLPAFTRSASVLWGDDAGTARAIEWIDMRHTVSKSVKRS